MAGWLQEQTRRLHVETAARTAHHPGPAGLHPQDQRQPYRGKQAHFAKGMRSPWVRILMKMTCILKDSVMDPHWIRVGFNADPDPACNVNVDPDPGSQTNADPDPGQSHKKFNFFMQNKLQVGDSQKHTYKGTKAFLKKQEFVISGKFPCLSLKTDVPTVSNELTKLEEKHIFCWHLESHR
jgi:hypothetical protein